MTRYWWPEAPAEPKEGDVLLRRFASPYHDLPLVFSDGRWWVETKVGLEVYPL